MNTIEPKKRRARRGRGEGSIFQRADGYWCANVSAGFGSNGKRRRRTLYGKTKAEVQKKLKDIGADTIGEAGTMTVGQLLTRWLESKKATVAPGSYVKYKYVVDRDIEPRLGGLRLSSIALVHVEGLYRSMQKDGLSAACCGMAGIVLGMALKYACRLKLISHNPVRDVDKPKRTKVEFATWTKDQAAEFLKAVAFDRLAAMYVLALTTGMRQGELFALEWSDINFDDGYLTVRRSLERIGKTARVKDTKSGKGRRIDLPQVALDALHDHRKAMLAEGLRTATVFVNEKGTWLDRVDVAHLQFHPIVKKAGLPKIRFHDLRHTHATLLLAAGENIKAVSERLGHANITITLQVYAHVLPTMQKSAADTMQKLLG